ncbi:MAG: methylated-DNA--[protein]-cysteine S-methyltransferase [Gammaproteobacteria bacterium]
MVRESSIRRTLMSDNPYSAVIATPLGKVGVHCTHDAIVGVDYINSRVAGKRPDGPLARELVGELQRYFRNPRYGFALPLVRLGTEFQRQVWRALQGIPLGETRTYGELAQQLDSGPRAVGNACRANPVPIVVPCHRVVAATGIGGYSGAVKGVRLDRKRWLLCHEGAL